MIKVEAEVVVQREALLRVSDPDGLRRHQFTILARQIAEQIVEKYAATPGPHLTYQHSREKDQTTTRLSLICGSSEELEAYVQHRVALLGATESAKLAGLLGDPKV